MSDEVAVEVNQVYKNFVLPHERVNSIKSLVTSAAKKRAGGSSEVQHALKDISFSINKGEFFGIVGRNGSGKSTMLKILAGIYQPTSGTVRTAGKLVPFIELGVGFNPELTGRENVFLNGAMLGFSQKEVEAMYEDIVSFAELERFMDQKLKNYSSGMQVRLAFSMATRSEADVLLVDEVLAVGDADFQRKCFDYFRELKKNKKTVIFVSHDMNAIREYCDRAVLIEKSELVISGSANDVAKEYSKMFIETAADTGSEPTAKTKRWGVGKIRYSKVKVQPTVISEQPTLMITTKAIAEQDVEDIVFGILIKNASDQNITGTNTQLQGKKIPLVKKGDEIAVDWEIPNIFSDGKYIVEPAIVFADGEVCDWWEEATTFTSAKSHTTPYLVDPSFKISINYPDKRTSKGL
ncbi:MAG: ABC transporter ATP-binding protein [Patescibacteria group bacterium]|nr:ABC transporter ATP-binding protein [Patescibacteria group bacterium]